MPPIWQVLLASLPQVTFSIYAVGPLVWTVHSDAPLLSTIVATLSIALVFVTVPIRLALGAVLASFLSSIASFATRPLISSFSSIPRFCSVQSFLACAFAKSVFFFHVIAHTSSYDMSLLKSWSLCVFLASGVPTFPQINWYWSVVGYHFVDDALQLFPQFRLIPSVPSRTPFDGLRHNFPHHNRLLRFIDHLELVIELTHF